MPSQSFLLSHCGLGSIKSKCSCDIQLKTIRLRNHRAPDSLQNTYTNAGDHEKYASLIIIIINRPKARNSIMYASPRQTPYAPTPYSYTPNTLSATINLDEVLHLFHLRTDASQMLLTLLEATRESPTAPSPPIAPLTLTSRRQEVRLSTSTAERDLYDSLAEIYSIIITLDGLEKAYIKDSVTESVYTEMCSRLLKQYNSNLTDETVAREFVDLETFKRTWEVRRPSLSRRCPSPHRIWRHVNW